MRFMIIVKATAESEQGCMPSAALMAEMARYHEELAHAGVLLDGSGLKPSAQGWRVRYTASGRTVTDGPFAEAREVIGGYAILKADSLDEALALTRRFLQVHGDEWDIECEVRPIEESPSGGCGRA